MGFRGAAPIEPEQSSACRFRQGNFTKHTANAKNKGMAVIPLKLPKHLCTYLLGPRLTHILYILNWTEPWIFNLYQFVTYFPVHHQNGPKKSCHGACIITIASLISQILCVKPGKTWGTKATEMFGRQASIPTSPYRFLTSVITTDLYLGYITYMLCMIWMKNNEQ